MNENPIPARARRASSRQRRTSGNRAATLAALATFAAAAAANVLPSQVPPSHALVATELPGARTQLLAVNLATGAATALPSFPSDVQAPLAVAIDPVNGEPIVAVRRAPGASRIVRLGPWGPAAVLERPLADVNGEVTDLAVADDGDVFAVVGGSGASAGVVRVPRSGGAPQQAILAPRAAALQAYGLQASHAWLAESGAPGTPAVDAQLRAIDLRLGTTTSGPHVLTGFPAVITGLGEVPTALVRLLVTDDGGRVWLVVQFAAPVQVSLTPALPAGATRALRMRTAFDAVVLGGASHPYLKTFQWPSATQWQMLAGPLPGDPVDFALAPDPGARVEVFGRSCAAPMTFGWNGLPQLGSTTFALQLHRGAPSSGAFLALGGSDQRWHSVPLPIPLPFGGCDLRVWPEVQVATTTDAMGFATVPLPIPALPSLTGGVVFAQWLQAAPTLVTSEGLAVHVWP